MRKIVKEDGTVCCPNCGRSLQDFGNRLGMVNGTNVPRYIPLTKWDQYYADPTVAGLRWMVFDNKEFVDRCVIKRGKRVLIDTIAYHEWLDEENRKARARLVEEAR